MRSNEPSAGAAASGGLAPLGRPQPMRPANRLWRDLCARFPALGKLDRRMSALRDIERLRRTRAFDARWYAAAYPDMIRSGLSPLTHYVRKGAWEGRRPRPDFDPLRYLAANPDVAESGIEPFTHYLLYGGGQATESALTGSESTPVGWYGIMSLTPDQLYDGPRSPDCCLAAAPSAPAEPVTAGAEAGQWFMRFGPLDEFQQRVASRRPPTHVPESPRDPSFTLVTVFEGDGPALSRSAACVAALMAQETERPRADWIVLNDDPACEPGDLAAHIPPQIRHAVTILSDGRQMGRPARKTQGAQAAGGDFVLFLEAGDLIGLDATRILAHYAGIFPRARAVGCGAADVDERGRVLRRTALPFDSSKLLALGMVTGPLLALRRDLLADLGGFEPRFAGLEDYDLLLRVALEEPILVVPDSLIGSAPRRIEPGERREQRMAGVRMAAMRRLLEVAWPAPALRPPRRGRVEQGLCLVRTQGRRPELLAAALQSIYAQSEPLVAAVIVHGDAAAFEQVRTTAPVLQGRTVFLHADASGQRRGYPWNVGLAYARARADTYHYVCFLDDDDVYYPLFARRMLEGFRLAEADVVFGLTNKRLPGAAAAEPSHMPLPTACLVAGNFMPTNSYAVRTELLVEAEVLVAQDMDYFEDWDLLVSLLAAGGRFHLIPEAVGEFLLIGDGNTLSKRDPVHHAQCLRRALARGEETARKLGMAQFYRDLLDFDFGAGAARHPAPLGHLMLAKKQFLRAFGDA
ncbi:glycosyltransferase [Aquabacter sp. P-9]|nr:glycosyltransferase [Aquabacter sp. P-9]